MIAIENALLFQQSETLKVQMQHLDSQLGRFEKCFSLQSEKYYYYQFENGYGLTYQENILEIGQGHLFDENKENYYLGFGAYYYRQKNILYHYQTNEELKMSLHLLLKGELLNRTRGLLELPENLIKRSKKTPDEKDSFIGVEEEQLAPYQDIITKDSNLCGTSASGVLFSYLQDHDQLYLPTILRRKKSLAFQPLLDKIKKFVQPIPLPTVPVQIAFGWRRFFRYYHLPVTIFTQSLGAKASLKKLLQEKQPALLGILTFFGSEYGNHWVVAYSYQEVNGVTYYKIHDNWGNYRKIIPATLGNGVVTIKKRTL